MQDQISTMFISFSSHFIYVHFIVNSQKTIFQLVNKLSIDFVKFITNYLIVCIYYKVLFQLTIHNQLQKYSLFCEVCKTLHIFKCKIETVISSLRSLEYFFSQYFMSFANLKIKDLCIMH